MDNTGNPWRVSAADVAAAETQIWPPLANGQTNQTKAGGTIGHAIVMGLEVEFFAVAAGDVCTINDLNGNLIWTGKNTAADLGSVRSGMLPGPFNGVVIPAGGITNGNITIYHR